MDSREGKQIISLIKRYLIPNVRKWWKRRQQSQQQSQQQSAQSQQYPDNTYAQTTGQPAQQYYGIAPQQPYNDQQQYHNQSLPPQQQYRPPTHTNSDIQNAQDPHYIALRNQAIQEGNLMHQAFDGASRAHQAGDGARAKQLSTQGHTHQQRKDDLNRQAADFIFNANNRSQPPGSIDLHGLFVQEAIERTERAVQTAQSQGLSQLRVITGKGIHSQNHVAKIKPAIEQLMVKYNLSAHLDEHNSGVLIVNLAGGGSRDLGWVDQADREAPDGNCLIM